MKILIVEDDFVGRYLLQMIIAPFGECDVVINGEEAVELFKISCDESDPYHLILLDINMPIKDGQTALTEIRNMEEEYGLEGLRRAKIIMTTANDDFENVTRAFNEQCDAYLVKPIEIKKIGQTLEKLGLI